jgi:sorbitol/mannitol transport system permease protein
MAVLDKVAVASGEEILPRRLSARQRWVRRLPLLPALIYVIVVTQIPFVVTVYYSFQSYFWDIPAPAHFTGFSNYSTVFTNPAFRGRWSSRSS